MYSITIHFRGVLRKNAYLNRSRSAPQMSSRNWCFTINGVQPDLITLPPHPLLRYSIFSLEKGSALHAQGYAEFTAPLKLSACSKWIPGAHFEPRKGTREQARDYCKKSESHVSGPFEHGTWAVQGKRTDLDSLTDTVTDHKDPASFLAAISAADPGTYIKYFKGLKDWANAPGRFPVSPLELNLRPWQNKVLAALIPSDRTIHWVYDPTGGSGKSTLCRYLESRGAIQLKGKVADMAYAYTNQPIVLFDLTRTMTDHMDHLYDFAESLKNGFIFSTKYESVGKRFTPPHVIFFANSLPDRSKWTADRLVLHEISSMLFPIFSPVSVEVPDVDI